MQPAASIHPYREDTLTNLIGLKARVPKVKNPSRNWLMEIRQVRFVNEHSAAVWVVPLSSRAGKGGRWVDLSIIRWRKPATDPLVIAVIKGREYL